jgi:hypothetical protein
MQMRRHVEEINLSSLMKHMTKNMEEKPIRKEKYPDKNNLIQHHDYQKEKRKKEHKEGHREE